MVNEPASDDATPRVPGPHQGGADAHWDSGTLPNDSYTDQNLPETGLPETGPPETGPPETGPPDSGPNEAQIQAILERRRQAQSPPAQTQRPPQGHNPTVSRKDHLQPGPALSGSQLSAEEWPYPLTKSNPDRELANNQGIYPVDPPKPRLWERQPYAAIAQILLTGGAIATAWLLGILVAQVLPGRFEKPPFPERMLRKTGRLTSRVWHFSSLWDTPTTQSRIEAIPLPETGPISGPIELAPIERQPLVDELNAIETEVITLERRLKALENRLGNPIYQGASIDSRIDTLRIAIDPPVRPDLEPTYEPTARQPNDTLLDVAKLSLTLPSDALFMPGESQLKAAELLNEVLDQLVNYPGATISIRSYSDDQAAAKDSSDYTLAQAIALTRYLQQALPTDHRWIAVGIGQAQPAADNGDAAGRQRNRRIEILVDTR